MMRTLWNIGAAVLGQRSPVEVLPPGQFCFLRDHTGDRVLFWRFRDDFRWSHYSLHPFWHESRLQSHSINLALGGLFPDVPIQTRWLPLMRMLKHSGWQLVDLRVDYSYRRASDESQA